MGDVVILAERRKRHIVDLIPEIEFAITRWVGHQVAAAFVDLFWGFDDDYNALPAAIQHEVYRLVQGLYGNRIPPVLLLSLQPAEARVY